MKNILFAFLIAATASLAHAAQPDLDYFKRFLYQEKVDDTDPENIKKSYRYVMTEFDKKIPLSTGEVLNPSMSLFLLADGTYVVYYRENIFPDSTSPGFRPAGCKKITGTWTVPEDKLILSGFGFATRARHMNQIAVEITLEQQIISKEAVGMATKGTLGFSNSGINEAFCF